MEPLLAPIHWQEWPKQIQHENFDSDPLKSLKAEIPTTLPGLHQAKAKPQSPAGSVKAAGLRGSQSPFIVGGWRGSGLCNAAGLRDFLGDQRILLPLPLSLDTTLQKRGTAMRARPS